MSEIVKKTSERSFKYGDYLKLDELLNCQNPRSIEANDPQHDELLFIIIHQAYELWFKQILYEIDTIRSILSKKYLQEKEKLNMVNLLKRIVTIQKILIKQMEVFKTMTPQNFIGFRKYLGSASGFQGLQFRLIENKLGLPPESRLLWNKKTYMQSFEKAETIKLVEASLSEPTLFQLIEKWLESVWEEDEREMSLWTRFQAAINEWMKKEFDAKTTENFSSIFDEDQCNKLRQAGSRRLNYRAFHGAILLHNYGDETKHLLDHKILKLVTKIDSLLAKWRSEHAIVVRQMIGSRNGTGESSGYNYLKATASNRYRIFLDVESLSTFIIPQKFLPKFTKTQLHLNGYEKEESDLVGISY